MEFHIGKSLTGMHLRKKRRSGIGESKYRQLFEN
jgi:hypothetical protein